MPTFSGPSSPHREKNFSLASLVHHDVGRHESPAAAERHVRENFGRAAENARFAVDARVAGQHPDVLGTQLPAQREELLARERLDRARVKRHLPFAGRLEVEAESDERLA